MSSTALLMMTLAIALVWGGLVLAIVHLVRHPDETSGHLPDEAGGLLDGPELGAGHGVGEPDAGGRRAS